MTGSKRIACFVAEERPRGGAKPKSVEHFMDHRADSKIDIRSVGGVGGDGVGTKVGDADGWSVILIALARTGVCKSARLTFCGTGRCVKGCDKEEEIGVRHAVACGHGAGIAGSRDVRGGARVCDPASGEHRSRNRSSVADGEAFRVTGALSLVVTRGVIADAAAAGKQVANNGINFEQLRHTRDGSWDDGIS